MARTPTEWVRMLERERNTAGYANTILGDLLGYRKTSLQRAEDTDNLTYALEAAMLVARRTAPSVPPELAGALARGDREMAQRTATALSETTTMLEHASHALSKYGQHFTTCDHIKGRACTCGLDAIKAKLA